MTKDGTYTFGPCGGHGGKPFMEHLMFPTFVETVVVHHGNRIDAIQFVVGDGVKTTAYKRHGGDGGDYRTEVSVARSGGLHRFRAATAKKSTPSGSS